MVVAHQAPLFMGFPRQEYWSGLPFPSPGDFTNSVSELSSLLSCALSGRFFTTELPGKPVFVLEKPIMFCSLNRAYLLSLKKTMTDGNPAVSQLQAEEKSYK